MFTLCDMTLHDAPCFNLHNVSYIRTEKTLKTFKKSIWTLLPILLTRLGKSDVKKNNPDSRDQLRPVIHVSIFLPQELVQWWSGSDETATVCCTLSQCTLIYHGFGDECNANASNARHWFEYVSLPASLMTPSPPYTGTSGSNATPRFPQSTTLRRRLTVCLTKIPVGIMADCRSVDRDWCLEILSIDRM